MAKVTDSPVSDLKKKKLKAGKYSNVPPPKVEVDLDSKKKSKSSMFAKFSIEWKHQGFYLVH